MKKISIILSGLGMGNSSRCEAVIQQLLLIDPQLELSIFTWGNGTMYFQSVLDNYSSNIVLIDLHSLSTGNIFLSLKNYFLNTIILIKSFVKNKPNRIILDSDYHFLSYLFLRNRVFYISQAADVVSRFFKFKFNWTFKELINFFVLEFLDLCFQVIVSRNILVPCFYEKNFLIRKLKSVPLIVRKNFLNFNGKNSATVEVGGVLLSGSGLEFEKIERVFNGKKVQIISPERREKFKVSEPEIFKDFKYVITQGGLSSISEMLSMKMPLLVLPISNHVEQRLNGLEVESSGLGKIYNVNKSFEEQVKSISNQANAKDVVFPSCDGAKVIAKIILD